MRLRMLWSWVQHGICKICIHLFVLYSEDDGRLCLVISEALSEALNEILKGNHGHHRTVQRKQRFSLLQKFLTYQKMYISLENNKSRQHRVRETGLISIIFTVASKLLLMQLNCLFVGREKWHSKCRSDRCHLFQKKKEKCGIWLVIAFYLAVTTGRRPFYDRHTETVEAR